MLKVQKVAIKDAGVIAYGLGFGTSCGQRSAQECWVNGGLEGGGKGVVSDPRLDGHLYN